MSIFDKFKKQASDAVGKHGDKISQGLEKAANLADQRTGGKHTDKIDKGVSKAKDTLDKLDDKGDGKGGSGSPGRS